MPALNLQRVPFVCACGFGQKGELFKGDPDGVKWDGRTYIETKDPDKAKCPNCNDKHNPEKR